MIPAGPKVKDMDKDTGNSQKYIGVMDLGTTSVRFIVFDLKGEMVSLRQEEIGQQYPGPGLVEEDPREIFNSLEQAAGDTFKSLPGVKDGLAALGICNQRESVMLWDRRDGKPVSPLIVWQDRRTAARCRELKSSGYEDIIKKKTGLAIDPYFSATKIEWLLKDDPGLRSPAKDGDVLGGTLDSWVIFRLTGDHYTDISNASRTMLFNIDDGKWDRELLDIFHIPEAILPIVRPSLGKALFGYTRKSSVFGRKIPVCCVMGDQQASLFGHRCFARGQVKCTFGTGSFLISNTGGKRIDSKNGLISTIFYQEQEGDPCYALEGSIYNTGSTLKWLRDNMGLLKSYEDIDKMAEGTDHQDRLYLVPALTGLGAPYWDPEAGALIIGFDRSTSPGDIIRAALESAAFRTRDVIKAMEADSGTSIKEVRIDGGVAKSRLFCQLLADITGKRIIKPDLEETTSLGIFFGAGLAAGIWDHKEDIDIRDKNTSFEPMISSRIRETIYKNWERAVEKSLNWHSAG